MVKVLWYDLEYVSQTHGGLLMEEKNWEQCSEKKNPRQQLLKRFIFFFLQWEGWGIVDFFWERGNNQFHKGGTIHELVASELEAND